MSIGSLAYPRDPAQYELLGVVGTGGSSVVHRARCVPLDEEVAVKIINLDGGNISMCQFAHEATLMRKSNHPNVLRMKGSFICGSELWLVIQFHPHGSVYDVMTSHHTNGFRDESLVLSILVQVLEGIKYFHSIGALHRDLKAANLLVARNGDIRLSDFGVSVTANECPESSKQFAGSPCWMAPEALSTAGYQAASDIWALGITAIELLCGKPPHHKHKPVKVFSLVLRGEAPTVKSVSPQRAAEISPDLHDFISKCLIKDTEKRWTAAQLQKHRVLQRFKVPGTAAAYMRNKLAEYGTPDICASESGSYQCSSGVALSVMSSQSEGTWDYPAVNEAAEVSETDPNSWRHRLQKNHKHEFNRFERCGVLFQSGRLIVYSAKCKMSLVTVALHEYEVDPSEYKSKILTDKFIDTITSHHHQCSLSCKALWEDGNRAVFWVTESKASSSLALLISTSGKLGGGDVQRITSQLIQSVAMLHSQDLIHGQLTSHHVYVVEQYKVKFDFATALIVEAASVATSTPREWIRPPCGMAVESLLAPEVLGGTKTKAADTYGIGIIVLHMVSGKFPFREFGAADASTITQEKQLGRPPIDLQALPITWRSFVSQCLAVASNRPQMSELIDHTALQGVVALLPNIDDSTSTLATCPACLGPPTDSRRLDCEHCVCLKCSEQAHAFSTKMHSLLRHTSGWAFGEPSRAFVCPQCGAATYLCERGVESLPLGVIKVPICDHCEEKPAETECDQCMVTMCQGCSSALHKRGRFKNHTVKPLIAVLAGERDNQLENLHPGDDAAGVVERLRERGETLKSSTVRLEKHLQTLKSDASNAKEQIKAWGVKLHEIVTKHQDSLLSRIDQIEAARTTTCKSQLELAEILSNQIDVVLSSSALDADGGLSGVALRRFQSLLATPCASDPQRCDITFTGDLDQLSSKVAKLGTLTISASQLAWSAPPGPAADRASRTVVVLAAVILSSIAAPPVPVVQYSYYRVIPIGIPSHSNWKIRQLLVFSPEGGNIADTTEKVTASGSVEGFGPDQIINGGGTWCSPEGSGDSSWLQYRLQPGEEVSTVVVRSYPQQEHAPNSIQLEGSTDGEHFTAICTEEVQTTGTACWDCLIAVP
eukprot:TRINITY_DN16256_c0_g1_i1.p1 TRINITY_DN16256_c0_g1~~TRINITY_DN16256_c0_g1_i1.p1  ORF type:complete len:1112 (+),score=177.60 TRINITY_DN16256_c0_g1_i1:37-3372(+)